MKSWRPALVSLFGLLFVSASSAPMVRAGQETRGLAPPGLGPFEQLREPHFVPAAQAAFMKDEDRVLAASGNGVAKAYLTHVAAWHHIISDQLGKAPILVTW
jgi:hypothetical protein